MENITTKEQALELIQSIVKNERFKVDAYFFCGFPTDQPNEKLIQLCEAYLEKQDAESKTAMLTEMERMVAVPSWTPGRTFSAAPPMSSGCWKRKTCCKPEAYGRPGGAPGLAEVARDRGVQRIRPFYRHEGRKTPWNYRAVHCGGISCASSSHR